MGFKLHIGLVTLESPFDTKRGGGIAAYLRAIIPGLLDAGHRVTVIANSTMPDAWYDYDTRLRVIHICLPSLHWYLTKVPYGSRTIVLPLRQLEWSLKFYRVARQVFLYDPVDVIEGIEVGSLLLSRNLLAPLIIRLHGSDYTFRKYTREPLHVGSRWNHYLEQTAWKQARGLTSPSCFQATEVIREMGWPKHRIRVIPNPIASEMLVEARQNCYCLDHHTKAPTVLYTGRLARVKGTQPLLDAINRVHRIYPTTRFTLAGPWQMSGNPEQWGLRQNEATEGGHVFWAGHIPWNELTEWYGKATVFVMPSYYETFGISCLEAMAFGLPVVATTAGGLPEIVEDGVTGILVPPGDSQALAKAIVYLLRNPDVRQRMGQAGRERVLAKFTADRVVEQTLAAYHEVVRSS